MNNDDFKITVEPYLKDSKGNYNWLFNWTSGGFNDVWAKTKEEAIQKASQEGLPTYMPDNEYATKTLKDVGEEFGEEAVQFLVKKYREEGLWSNADQITYYPEITLDTVGFSKGLIPSPDTFRKATKSSSDAQNEAGWLNTM